MPFVIVWEDRVKHTCTCNIYLVQGYFSRHIFCLFYSYWVRGHVFTGLEVIKHHLQINSKFGFVSFRFVSFRFVPPNINSGGGLWYLAERNETKTEKLNIKDSLLPFISGLIMFLSWIFLRISMAYLDNSSCNVKDHSFGKHSALISNMHSGVVT